MRFSDFHFPQNTPVFPQHQDVHNYLCEYAENFNLFPHIQFNTKVLSLNKSSTYDTTGRWIIQTTKNDSADDIVTKEYDNVIISTGFQRHPFIPDIEGLSDFKGTYTHSQTFKNGDPYKDKRVLVIGELMLGDFNMYPLFLCVRTVITSHTAPCLENNTTINIPRLNFASF